jgi:ABC-type Mn2+/Zn2+ transport system permease subunit
MAWLIEPLAYGFVLRGLAAGLLASVACASLSAFVVWRGMAFAGDALAHSVLPGIVVAYLLGFSLLLGALGAALIAVVGIGLISGKGALREDTAIGVMFSGLFALGVVLLSRVAGYQDLNHALFGNILGVTTGDLIAMAVVVLVIVFAVVLFYKELLVTSFDPVHAVAIGLRPEIVRYGLLAAIALTTVVAVQSVGVVLVLALLVTPGAAASLLSQRLKWIMAISGAISAVATLAGFYVSYYADIAAGPSIVLVLTLFFVLAWFVARATRRLAARRQGRIRSPRRST